MPSASQFRGIPIESKVDLMRYHVEDKMVTMPGNRLLSLIRVKGVSHEMKDDEELKGLYFAVSRYYMALARKEGQNLMVQTYISGAAVKVPMSYKIELPALQDFVDAYTAPFRGGKYRQVFYSFALILKYRDLDDGIQRMDDLLATSKKMLADFDPAIMNMEENQHSALFSQIGRFYSGLFNGEEQDVLVSDTRLGDAVIDSVTSFGAYDFVENRPNSGGQRFATTYDLRDYPTKGSKPGMWNEALAQPYDFTVVQTLLFEDRAKSKTGFKKHESDLLSVEGDSKQIEELSKAVTAIVQGEKAFGLYHAALIVYGETPDLAIENGTSMAAIFGMHESTFVRSTMTNIDTWCTQYPGYTDVLYPMIKSNDNLACTFSMHVAPTGKATGNPIGDGTALMPMRTDKGGLYYLNAHDSPLGQNNTGEMFPGHMAFTGQTGTGKTTAVGKVVTFASRFGTGWFGIDYNQSLKNLLMALNTQYYNLEPGIVTDINPFQFEDTQRLRTFLQSLVVICAGGVADDEEQTIITRAIAAVMNHSVPENRGMSLLLQNITRKGGNCLHSRLVKWSRLKNGQNAWVLDSPVNKFDPKLSNRVAFDCTAILKASYTKRNPEIVEVLLNTLFYMKGEVQALRPGSLFIDLIAEYWVPLSFDSTADLIQEILKAGRLRGEFLIMDTQSPEDAINTKYAPAVVQQLITTVWLANTRAQRAGYETFGVTGKVFDELKKMRPTDREAIVLQGHQAVKVSFELDSTLKYWLPLLSTTQANAKVAEDVRRELQSSDPNIWVPVFLERMNKLESAEAPSSR
jgi:type IV secretion system protein VirB4